jgi:hypothetical protein
MRDLSYLTCRKWDNKSAWGFFAIRAGSAIFFRSKLHPKAILPPRLQYSLPLSDDGRSFYLFRADIKMRFAAQKVLNRGLLFLLCYTLLV